MSFLKTIIFLLLLLTYSHSFSQVVGCKDPAATNYNPLATTNDGSCQYAPVYYSPTLKVNPLDTLLKETSGLQMAGNFLWTFNDGNNAAAIYRIDTQTKVVLQKVVLQGATNIDWEDIAYDGTYFYLGDFGNNSNGARVDLKIYKFPFSAIPSDYVANDSITVPATQIEAIEFSYSTQLPVTATTSNNTKYDCEAMIVLDGKIHLFTKNWVELNTVHYVINGTAPGSYSATPVDTLATGFLVTAADITPNGKAIALLGYQTSGFANHFLYLLTDFSNGFFFNGNKRKISLPDVFTMGQAEGICFANNNAGYISNERITNPITIAQKLHSFSTTAFMPMMVLPVNLLEFKASNNGTYHQLNWTFHESPGQLKLMRSVNGSDLSEIKILPTGKAGSYLIKGETGKSCYQLAWKENDGSTQYSNTVCLSNSPVNAFSQLVLQRSGQLTFAYHGSQRGSHTLIRLISSDGKQLKQVQEMIKQGSNKIDFATSLKGVAIIQFICGNEQSSFLLPVQ